MKPIPFSLAMLFAFNMFMAGLIIGASLVGS
jgi:hypothetical protein